MANEKRLVNAEAIARKLKYAHCTDCNVVRKIQCSACWVGDVLELLEGDSVDAVEVVHGRWIASGCGFDCCSECRKVYADGYLTAMGIKPRTQFSYCPNCGAKMDGEREKDNE